MSLDGKVWYPRARVRVAIVWRNGGEVQSIDAWPISLSVERNNFRSADTFRCEFQNNDVPWDPKAIKAMRFEAWIGRATGVAEGFFNSTSDPADLRRNQVIFGFVDDLKVELSDDGYVVTVEGRDMTSLLLDLDWPKGQRVPLGRPLDEVIRAILDLSVTTEAIPIENRVGGALPVIAEVKADGADQEDQIEAATEPEIQAALGLTGDEAGAGEAAGEDSTSSKSKHTPQEAQTFWDVITDLTTQAGLIDYFDLDTLVIDDPRTLFDIAQARPFTWGRNLSTLSFAHHFGRKKGLNIEVLSYDQSTGRTLTALYPDPPEATEVPTADSKSSRVEITRFVVSNIDNEEHLAKIARSVYEQVVREDVKGSMTTDDDRDMAGEPINTLKNGNAVQVTIGPDGRAFLQQIASTQGRIEQLVARGFPTGVAATIAENLDTLDRPWFVETARFDFTADEGGGLTTTVDFVNFLDADAAGAEAAA